MQLRALWVNSGSSRLRDRSRLEFERTCALQDIVLAELLIGGPEGAWDLICFDFDYPEMSGLKLMLDVKSRAPSVPIVMLTLQKSADLAVWALRSRVFDLLVKPADADEVEVCLQRVRGALRAKRTQRARDSFAIAMTLPVETRYRPRQPVNPRLQLAVAHVVKHFARSIPESEVALLCNLSPSRFCREFKAAFGVTFTDYLVGYRVLEAKRLLTNPGMSVADVAANVGFVDPSYFSRVFRKQEGLSPSEYRLAAARALAQADPEPPLALEA